MVSRVKGDRITAALSSWAMLHQHLPRLTVRELYDALALEASTRNRRTYKSRIIGRIVARSGHEIRKDLKRKYQ